MSTLITENSIREAALAVAQSQVGRHFGVGNVTPYGTWYGPGWERALFCAAGFSWTWYQALGHEDAHDLMGHQTVGGIAPRSRGFVWTVAMWNQLRRVGTGNLHTLKVGDALLFKYPTSGDRNTNPVNHVDFIKKNDVANRRFINVGYNVPRPGAPAGSDQSQGGGVWERWIGYNDAYLVGGVSLPVSGLASFKKQQWSAIQGLLTDLELAVLQGTGTVGPSTTAALKVYANEFGYTGDIYNHRKLLPHMEATMSELLAGLKALNAKIDRQDKVLATLEGRSDAKYIQDAVWSKAMYGFDIGWWIRQGLVLDPKHRNFPADPGSPADKRLRQEAAQDEGYVKIYQPGAGLTELKLDPATNRFVPTDRVAP